MKTRNIIIILLVGFLLGSGVLNYFQDRRNEKLKADKENIEKLKDQLKESRKNLARDYMAAQDSINNLRAILDSTEKSYALKTAEIASEKLALEKELIRLVKVPPDTVYRKLFAVHPSGDQVLRYPFSENQIRGMYGDHIRLKHNLSINRYLQGQVNTMEFSLRTKENIIKYKDVQIGALKTDITLSDSYADNLEQLNADLNKAYKSERTTKHIWQGATGVAILFIILSQFK